MNAESPRLGMDFRSSFEASDANPVNDVGDDAQSVPASPASQGAKPFHFPSADLGPSLRQVEEAYVQFKDMTAETARALESRSALIAAECEELQIKAIEMIHASACAAGDFFEALAHSEAPAHAAEAQIEHFRRQRDVLNGHMAEYLASARDMIALLAAPLDGRAENCPHEKDCRSGPCDDAHVLQRLSSLTPRQRRVLALLIDGLPNKVIAYELGICETTVKAHVGVILKKLCVYNRARAIAMLARLKYGAGGLLSRLLEQPSAEEEAPASP